MWRGHALSGVLVGGAASQVLDHPAAPNLAVVAVGAAVGAAFALVPDLDHRHGKLTHSLGPLTWLISRVFIALAKATYAATRGPADPRETDGHRGLTHTLEFEALCGAVAGAALLATPLHPWALFVGVTAALGAWAHTLGDCCTTSGVPVLLARVLLRAARGEPRRWVRWGIPESLRFRTGGPVGEPVVTLFLLVGCLVGGYFVLIV